MKRIFILSLTFLLLCHLPCQALAALSIKPAVMPNESGEYQIVGEGTYTISGDGTEDDSCIYLEGPSFNSRSSNPLIITLQDVNLTSKLNIKGNVTLLIEGENVLNNGLWFEVGCDDDRYYFESKDTLTIDGSGSLIAIGNPGDPENPKWPYGSAGIGLSSYDTALLINGGMITAIGGYGCSGIGGEISHIIINGGNVTARGGHGGAGIGGQLSDEQLSSNGKINVDIRGGIVAAEGGYGGAGVGSGLFIPSEYNWGPTVSISINGGQINSQGGTGGAGIGGAGDDVHIAIEGGEITSALGGAGDDTLGGGAGIGGNQNSSATVYISGGNVSANGNSGGAGIGGGENADGFVTIIGGIVTANSSMGAGIGGGENGAASISIADGILYASSENTAIGCGSYMSDYLSSGSVTILGGMITAHTEYGIAIYAGPYGNIVIDGGSIEAEGHIIGNAIIINNGYIHLNAPHNHAGIRGGRFSNITINGGTILGEGRNSAIEGQRILITGGQIGSKEIPEYTPFDPNQGVGINGDFITITGGDIFASGDYLLAAIGGHWENHCEILITGGNITAYGSDEASGIGNGKSTSNIVIQGGEIEAYGVYGIDADQLSITGGNIIGTIHSADIP